MRRIVQCMFCSSILVSIACVAQTSDQTPLLNPTAPKVAQTTALVDPYKATLDKLDSFSNSALSEWRWHTDIPHPEDAQVNDSDWAVMAPDPKADTSIWKTGTRVFRRVVEIPAKVNGYATAGSRVRLDHFYNSPEA